MKNKNFWVLLVLLMAGIVIGGFVGGLAENISWLSWLDFGQSFGLKSPLVLDLGVLIVTFALTIKITLAGIIGMTIAVVIFRHL